MLPRHTLWLRDDGSNRETTGEGAGFRKYLDKNNAGVRRVDKRRKDEERDEVGVKENFKKKSV